VTSELQLIANVGIAGVIALGVLRLLYREVPKIALYLARIDRRVARLLERRGIPDSDAPPIDDEPTGPGRARRRSLLPRLPRPPHDTESDV
jgi:hypothetical protein